MALKSDNPESQAPSESEELSLRALPTWELSRDGSTLRINGAAAARFGDSPIDQLFDDRSEFKALVERGFEGVPLRPFDLLNGRRGVLLVEKSEADSSDRIRVGLLDVTHAHLLEQESAFSERLRAVCNLATRPGSSGPGDRITSAEHSRRSHLAQAGLHGPRSFCSR